MTQLESLELRILTLMEMVRDRIQREEGQGGMEYAIVALVVVLAIAGVASVMEGDISTAIGAALGRISSTIGSVT